MALRLQWDCVLLVTDSEVASARLVQLKAFTWLKIQHAMLRSVSRSLCASRLQGYVVWCPSHLQPGDPLSRVQSDFHGRLARAEVASQVSVGKPAALVAPVQVRGSRGPVIYGGLALPLCCVL